MQNINQLLSSSIVFRLEKLEYFPVARHNPMLVRPYMFNVQQEAVETLMNRMDEKKSGRVTPGLLQGVTSGIVTPSPVGYDTAIDNSWVGTRRFLFMMKVSHIDPYQGHEVNTYLIGYTEYDGITPNGHIDPNMPHFINNIIETSVYYYNTPLGTQRVEKLLHTYDAIYSVNNLDMYTQRPVDLYQAVSAQETAMFTGLDLNVANAGSMINPFNNNVVSSTAENNITTEYLSKILTSGMHAVKAREIHVNSYNMGSDDPSEKFFTEPSVNETAFVKYLSRLCGYKGVRPIFGMSHLMQIDPTVYDRFTLYNVSDEIRDPLLAATPEVGDFWHGRDIVTTKAYSLIENCVSLANKYGFTKMSFSATNMDNPLQVCNVGIMSFKSFLSISEHDMNVLLEIFKEKFHIEIFLSETASGKVPLFMECHINIHGTSKIYLEYSGYQGNWFTIPTFAGSAFAPVLTFDQTAVDTSANHLNNVLNTLVQAQQPGIY